MSDIPTWQFPPRNGGIEVIQDQSSAHFRDDPIPKLVREALQNSLDANDKDLADPVEVKITEAYVDANVIGAAELKKHLSSCRARAREIDRPNIQADYDRALEALLKNPIRCLKIVDSGTMGLKGASWNALVFQEGSVSKQGGAPGGSNGVGKNAVFNVSDLRTVFYSTRCLERGRVEKLQGKATLMSHPNPANSEESLQHVGFFSVPGGNPILTREIPAFFRLGEVGTGVFIMGFNPRSSEWVKEVTAATIENFFYAIHRKNLVVKIASQGSEVVVNHETLDWLFEGQDGDKPSYHYYKAIRDQKAVATDAIGKIGPLDVYLSIGSGSRRTAYINRNGMLITDSKDQKFNPVAPRGRNLWPDYVAVVVPATDRGDSWVRKMESTSHDSLSYQQLQEDKERKEAKKVLDKARSTIRDIIDQEVQVEQHGDTSNLDELAQWFPELDPKMPGNKVLKTLVIPTRGPQIIDNPSPGPDPGPEPGPGPRPSPDPGPGPGPRPGPDPDPVPGPNPAPGPNPGPGPRPNRLPRVRNSRFILTGQSQATIAFTPSENAPGAVSLSLIPEGGEATHHRRIDITGVEVVSPSNLKVSINNGAISLTPEAEERIVLKVTTKEPIKDLAFRIG